MNKFSSFISKFSIAELPVEKAIAAQEKKLIRLRNKQPPDFLAMEVAQERLLELREQRRKGMNPDDLRRDLEKQYGTSRWAQRFIDDMLKVQMGSREAIGLI